MVATKMPVKYAVVDAFTDTKFKGNPAAVCLLEEDRDDQWLQSISTEFNLPMICFLTRVTASDSQHPQFKLRWFTTVEEVELCGHATLAASHVCFTSGLVNGNTIEFSTLSGILTAKKVLVSEESESVKSDNGGAEQQFFIELDFPPVLTTDYIPDDNSLISDALNGASVVEIRKTEADDLFVVLSTAKIVADFQPDFEKIRKCPGRGLIINALTPPGSDYDFFSRFFCPKLGVNEDSVCGQAHCALALYWSKKLGKYNFLAYAASPRSGIVKLQMDEQRNRVKLKGRAVTVMEGSIIV